MALDDIRDTLTNRMANHRDRLDELVRIPSVSAPGFDPAHVRASAERTCALLEDVGLQGARLLELDGAHPAVLAGDDRAGPDAPTVLLYAHHDVQPPGDEAAWSSPPFEPTERDGRLYGRGAADDKAGVVVHLAAVDAWLTSRDALPCNVKVFVEGEEETGSEHLEGFLERYADDLAADALILTDSVNWRVGVPAVTTSLRGLVDCEVELRGLDHAVHSGMYGGPVPDPLTALVKLLAAMTDERGAVAIPGLADDVARPDAAERERIEALDFDEAGFRADAGLLDGVELGGDPDAHPLERLWLRPNVTVIGLDAPAVEGSSNTLVPSARARVSMRLAPGQDPQRALDTLCRWLMDTAPWGMHVRVRPGAAASGYAADHGSGAYRAAVAALEAAFDAPCATIGVGGSIPFVTPFTEQFAGAPALLTGVEDPDTRAHGIDESLHLDDWVSACLGEAYLLHELGRHGPDALR